ncbi:MAG: AAA family ATPase, partial [Candidatus Cloacimonadaceae bacterium]
MPEQIKQTLHQFVLDRFMQSRINDALRNTQQNHLIEIIGSPGSGKTYMIEPMIETLKKHYKHIVRYSPHPFWENHLKDLLLQITSLNKKELDKICSDSGHKIRTRNKHDYFFCISEEIISRDALKPCLLIIDDCDMLDSYSRDFLQYLVQYAEDKGIQVVALSQKQLFTFSEVELLTPLNIDDIEHLIQKSFPKSQIAYAKDSEILLNISGGNLLIIETILSDMAKVKKKEFDISNFIARQYDTEKIYLNTLNGLTQSRQKILLSIYLLEEIADTESLKKAVGLKNLVGDIDYLKNADLIYQIKDKWVVHKKKLLHNWIHTLKQSWLEEIYEKVLSYVKKLGCCLQLQVNLNILLKKYDPKLFDAVLKELNNLCDNDALLTLYQYSLSHLTDVENQMEATKAIGIIYSSLNQKDKAVEYFRQCLQLCVTNNLPAEEIVFLLASNLFGECAGRAGSNEKLKGRRPILIGGGATAPPLPPMPARAIARRRGGADLSPRGLHDRLPWHSRDDPA